jgi:hypothetical protein
MFPSSLLLPILGTLIRSLMIAGGVSVTFTADDITALGGALSAAIAAVWGVVDKVRRAPRVDSINFSAKEKG